MTPTEAGRDGDVDLWPINRIAGSGLAAAKPLIHRPWQLADKTDAAYLGKLNEYIFALTISNRSRTVPESIFVPHCRDASVTVFETARASETFRPLSSTMPTLIEPPLCTSAVIRMS